MYTKIKNGSWRPFEDTEVLWESPKHRKKQKYNDKIRLKHNDPNKIMDIEFDDGDE